MLRHRRLVCEPLEDRRLLSLTTAGGDSTADPIAFDSGEVGVVKISLECSEYSFRSVDGTAERLTAENLQTGGGSGTPALPQSLLRIALPPDADLESVRLTVVSAAETQVPGTHDLAPGLVAYRYAPVSTDDPRVAAAGIGDGFGEWDSSSVLGSLDTFGSLVLADPNQNIVDGRDADVYSTDAFLDSEYSTLVGAQQMGRWKIAEVLYSPFSYNPVTDEVRVVEAGQIELTFDTDSPLPAALMSLTHWDNDAAEILDNFSEAVDWYRQEPVLAKSGLLTFGADGEPESTSADFVIITTSEIVAGSSVLDDYVAMKERLGWSVYVATEADWGGGTGDAASENIRAWLKANYAAMGIEYVMLVGNPDPGIGDVPMKMTYAWGSLDQTDAFMAPTDYYYADLTSNWDRDRDGYYGCIVMDLNAIKPIHEVQVGRIPAYEGDYATLDSILNKTMAYQSEDDTAWRRNLLMPMAVLNYQYEGGWPVKVDGTNVAEALTQIAEPNGFDTFTLFEKEGVSPTPEPSDLPLTHDNLVERWASSPTGLVAWQGHGWYDDVVRKVWTADSNSNRRPDLAEVTAPSFFSSEDAALLDNTHPSVVFAASCLNAYPELANNLAYSLLANGAIGTFAATRVEYYESNHDWNPGDDSYGRA